jgi:hypothetical protein
MRTGFGRFGRTAFPPLGLDHIEVFESSALAVSSTTATLTSFNPSKIANQITWLEADLGVTGSPVTAWADQSGTGHNASVGALSSPHISSNTYNGRQAISGVDGSKGLGFASMPALGTTATIVLTCSPSSLTFTYIIAAAGGGSGIIESFSGSLLQYFLASGAENDTINTAPAAGLHQIIISQVDGVSLNIWYDGALVVNKTPSATINVTWNQLFGDGSGANGTNGDIVQFILYSGTAVNATQAAELRAWTKAKWGSP